ncbi:accessory gland protein Acp29AB-like [Drosophila biarmipes]|uniref:accessory gland protein Acp29AB-like n=1 Tax=Drosophila biarmipes TaxID=125945 RepID=UPI001CDAE6BD|nr:accessory gland protein Acp29AB-like [Drosophila biarmipes]
MFRLAVVLLSVLIVGDRNRSLAGTPNSVSPASQSEDLESRCNGHWFSRMRAVMDYVAENQDQWNACKAGIANETKSDQNQVKAQLSALQEAVTAMQTQQQATSKDFEERLGRLDSQLVAIKEILTSNETSLEPRAVTTVKSPPPKFELIGSRYFYFERNIKLNWYGAASRCREMGGHLATFKDREELLLVKSKKSLSSERFWTGINCLSRQDDHVSVASGRAASFFNWASDEPDSRWNVRCICINNDYEMIYYYCSTEYKFICQADDDW